MPSGAQRAVFLSALLSAGLLPCMDIISASRSSRFHVIFHFFMLSIRYCTVSMLYIELSHNGIVWTDNLFLVQPTGVRIKVRRMKPI